ncbi:ATP-binding protein [Streptomyces sp. NPDC059072]|uniref:ATP-binding protein n=1 Tax=Streptomyces sp. NPDC059072 TaxID=3346715 RepID=UPI003690A2BB
MTSNPASAIPTAQPAQPACPTHYFEMRFSSTPRGARLARRLSGERLHAWGIPYGTEAHDTLTLLVAELSANAVHHGRVPGRDFRVRLTATTVGTVRIEVTDTRGERHPEPATRQPGPDRTDGRGLLLVDALADRWGWHRRPCGGPGKSVWVEYAYDGRNRDDVGASRP